MQTFYRMQMETGVNKFGEGPYNKWAGMSSEEPPFIANMHRRHNESFAHPMWKRGCVRVSRDSFFGFESLKSLKKWFSDNDIKELYSLGFSVVKYRGTIETDGTQAIIDSTLPNEKLRALSLKYVLNS